MKIHYKKNILEKIQEERSDSLSKSKIIDYIEISKVEASDLYYCLKPAYQGFAPLDKFLHILKNGGSMVCGVEIRLKE